MSNLVPSLTAAPTQPAAGAALTLTTPAAVAADRGGVLCVRAYTGTAGVTPAPPDLTAQGWTLTGQAMSTSGSFDVADYHYAQRGVGTPLTATLPATANVTWAGTIAVIDGITADTGWWDAAVAITGSSNVTSRGPITVPASARPAAVILASLALGSTAGTGGATWDKGTVVRAASQFASHGVQALEVATPAAQTLTATWANSGLATLLAQTFGGTTGDAGADQTVKPFDKVTLTGTGTGTWAQTSGPTVDLMGSGSSVWFYAPPLAGGATLGFAFGGDPVTVTVLPHNQWKGTGATRRPERIFDAKDRLAPAVVATTTAAVASGTYIDIATPAGAQPGDALFAHVASNLATSASDVAPPAGWSRVGPPFLANSEAHRMTGWWTRTVVEGEPATHRFTAPATGRMIGTITCARSPYGPPVVVGASSSIAGTVSSSGHSPLACASSKGYRPTLALVANAGEYLTGQSAAVTVTPDGHTTLAEVTTGTDLGVTRSALWLGTRRNPSGGAGASPIQHAGSVTNGRTSQLLISAPLPAITAETPVRRWTRVVHETWSTPCAEGGWAASVYQSRYPTATDGEGDTKWNNTGGAQGGKYNRSQLSVVGGRLAVRVRTVGGVPLGGKVILTGWGGSLGWAIEGSIQAAAAPGFKALAAIGWPADPHVWEDGEIDCGEADLNGSQAGCRLYRNLKWGGWDALGVLSDNAVHTYRVENHPLDGVRFWWDGAYLGVAPGPPIVVPSWVGFQVETANQGPNPDPGVDSYVYYGPVDVFVPA